MSTTVVGRKVVKPVKLDELPVEDIFSVEVIGEPDQGKTHFSATFPKALFVDTEHKANIVLKKMPEKGHLWKKASNWKDIREAVDWALTQPDVKTIVIDNDDDIQDFAVEQWSSEHSGKRPIAFDPHGGVITVLYAQIYKMIDDLRDDVIGSGKYLVCTCRLKDEYVANIATGRRVRDGYKKFPWSLSMAIWIKNGIFDPATGKVHFSSYKFGEVVKNNYWGVDIKKGVTHQKPYIFDISYEGICEEMLKPWHAPDGVKLNEKTSVILKEAEEWLKGKGLI